MSIRVKEHYKLPSDELQLYAEMALKQQQGYFLLLQQNGLIPSGTAYSDNQLRAGIFKLIRQNNPNFNSTNLSDQHIVQMSNDLLMRIINRLYIDVEPNGIMSLILQAMLEKNKAKKVGLIREIMAIDALVGLKANLQAQGIGNYKVVDTSPKGGFADSLRYDIGVVFDTGIINSNKEYGDVVDQLNLEIKANLNSFHITGFQGKTLLSNEAYLSLEENVYREIRSYFITNKSIDHLYDNKFRERLAIWAVKWKLGNIFPIFFRLGQTGEKKQILLCTDYISNITGRVGVTGIIDYTPAADDEQQQIKDELERKNLTSKNKEDISRMAAEIVMKSINRYDLWYGKK